MADYLVYWKTFWRDYPDGAHPEFDFGTAQVWDVVKGDSLWCVTSGGAKSPEEWRLVQRLVVLEKYKDPKSDWPNRFRGDPTQSEAYQVSNQPDLTPALGKLRFHNDKPIAARGRKIGNAIQAGRQLTGADSAVLTKYARHLKRIAPSPALLDKIVGVSDDDFSPRLTATGAGFGDPKMNRKVERAAVSAVTEWYESEGWVVKSKEADKCGYDLFCQRGSREQHVEVKAVQGGLEAFIITAGETRCAKNDADFVLCVVTSALTNDPTLHFHSAKNFASDFDLAPLAYRAIRRNHQP